MRRLALLLGVTVLLAGCGGEKTVSPTAEKVVGTVASATTTTAGPAGNPASGAKLFTAQGCNGCHTFKPARSTATVGPDLDKLPEEAMKASRGSEQQFVHESIVNPTAYIEPGYEPPKTQMPTTYGQTLTDKQVADLVAYLTQKG
jgi:mono/diheme cytochrome c family protein